MIGYQQLTIPLIPNYPVAIDAGARAEVLALIRTDSHVELETTGGITPMQFDGGMPLEFVAARRVDHSMELEPGAGVLTRHDLPIDLVAGVRGSAQASPEWLGAVLLERVVPLEEVLAIAARSDMPFEAVGAVDRALASGVRVEWLVAVQRDWLVIMEEVAGVRTDAAAALENTPRVQRQVDAPVEFLTSLRADFSTRLEWGTIGFGVSSGPRLEILSQATGRSSNPVEVLARTQGIASAKVEFEANFRVDLRAHLEEVAKVQRDAAPETEVLSRVQPDAAAWLDQGASFRADAAARTEVTSRVQPEAAPRLDVVSRSQTDSAVPAEVTANFKAAQSSLRLEDVSRVQRDSAAQVQTLPRVEGRAAVPAENAALFRTDSRANLEGIGSLSRPSGASVPLENLAGVRTDTPVVLAWGFLRVPSLRQIVRNVAKRIRIVYNVSLRPPDEEG